MERPQEKAEAESGEVVKLPPDLAAKVLAQADRVGPSVTLQDASGVVDGQKLAAERDRLAAMTEKQFMWFVIGMAEEAGWMYYHTFDSRRSVAGYPDITFVRGRRLLFVETKRSGKKATPAQAKWLTALSEVEGVECYVWTPDTPRREIIDVLK